MDNPPLAVRTAIAARFCPRWAAPADPRAGAPGTKDLGRLRAVIGALRRWQPLGPRHRDQAQGGEQEGLRDCHAEADRVLVYRTRTGSHSDPFG
jgi:mRNA-degrading endonuclease YafQ of YafQ-DinJ toxin-antitoxin module